MVVAVCVYKSNPNGDPRNEGNPRMTELGTGYISPESFRRWCRNGLERYFGGKLLIPVEGAVGDGVDQLIKESGMKKKDFEGASGGAELEKLVCGYFIDARLFGGLITKPISRGIRGSVKIDIAESVNPLRLIFHKGVRKSHSSQEEATTAAQEEANDEKLKNGVFTSRVFVHFGLYPFTVEIDGEQAQKNGITYGDLDDMIETFLSMYSWFGSAVRSKVVVERIDIWQHSHPRGSCPASLLPMETKFVPRVIDEPVQSFKDYEVRVPTPPNGVTHSVIRPTDCLNLAEAAE
jgi:Cas7 group CRISPR-associated protein Csh2